MHGWKVNSISSPQIIYRCDVRDPTCVHVKMLLTDSFDYLLYVVENQE